jgi:hypothetical protein
MRAVDEMHLAMPQESKSYFARQCSTRFRAGFRAARSARTVLFIGSIQSEMWLALTDVNLLARILSKDPGAFEFNSTTQESS